MTSLARIISYIFHPLLVPTYGMLILFGINTHSMLIIPYDSKVFLISFVFISTFIFPALLILLLKRFGVIGTFQMDTQKERVLPILLVSIAFFVTYYFFKYVGLMGLLTLFMAGSTLLVLISLLVNYATKISLHLIAWGGLLGTLIGFSVKYNYDLSITTGLIIILTGIIASSRLKLNAHSPFQVYLGFLIGLIGMMGLLLLI